MSDEAAEALYVGVGVAATCVGVMCSLKKNLDYT
jgi:hypothetical protein